MDSRSAGARSSAETSDTLDSVGSGRAAETRERVESRNAAAIDARRDGAAPPRIAEDTARIRTDGKFFAAGSERFEFRGVTYGTFAPREDGARFPPRAQLERDLARMREVGFSVVRSYTVPSDVGSHSVSAARTAITPSGLWPSDHGGVVSRLELRR
jgi:hypothetical protein